MKKKQIIYLLIIILFIIIISAYISLNYAVPKEITIINYDFQIDSPEKAGFNLDQDKLHFGITCPGCQEQRKITINNNDNYPKKIKFYVLTSNQSTADYFSINPPSGTIINPAQHQEYTITLSIPSNVTPKKETGIIIIKQYKSLFN